MNKKVLVLGIFVILMFALVPVALADVWSVNVVGSVGQQKTEKTSLAPPTFSATSETPMTLSLSINSINPDPTQNLEFVVYQNGVQADIFDIGGTIGPDMPLSAGTVINRDIFFQNGVNPSDIFELEVRNYGAVDADYDLTLGLNYGKKTELAMYGLGGIVNAGSSVVWTAMKSGDATNSNFDSLYFMVNDRSPGAMGTIDCWSGTHATSTPFEFMGIGGYKINLNGNIEWMTDGAATCALSMLSGSADVSTYAKLVGPQVQFLSQARNDFLLPDESVSFALGPAAFNFRSLDTFYNMPLVFSASCGGVHGSGSQSCNIAFTITTSSGTVYCGEMIAPGESVVDMAVPCGPSTGFTGNAGEIIDTTVTLNDGQDLTFTGLTLRVQNTMTSLWSLPLVVANAGLTGYAFIGYDMTAGPDGSGSYDPDGGSLTYAWTCKGGTVSLGTNAQATPTWDVWKNCCAVTPCKIDDIFTMNLVVTDDEGDQATDSVIAHVKELPFASTSSNIILNELSPGVLSGSNAINGGVVNPTSKFVNGPVTDYLVTPMIGRCDLTGANVIVDPTGKVTVSGNSGTCKYNMWGVGSEDTIYMGIAAWIKAMYDQQDWPTSHKFKAQNFSDATLSFSAGSDRIPVSDLSFTCVPNPVLPNEPLHQTCQVTSFSFEGTKLGNSLASASGADLAFVWENKQFKVSSGALSNVVKELPDPDGFAAITSANMIITSTDAYANGVPIEYSGLAAIASSRLPAQGNQAPVAGISTSFGIIETDLLLDGSTSYDTDGTIMNYDWTCNGQMLVSGPASTASASWSVWQNCCTAPPCSIGQDIGLALTVTDNEGATATITVPVKTVERMIGVASDASVAVNEIAPGKYAGSAGLSSGFIYTESADFVENGPFTNALLKPQISECTLTNARVDVDQGIATITAGPDTVPGSSGGCINTDTDGVDAWILAILLEYEGMKDMAMEAKDLGEADVAVSASPTVFDTIPVSQLNIQYTLREPTLAGSQADVAYFRLIGPANNLVSEPSATVTFKWNNRGYYLNNGFFQNVVKTPGTAPGITNLATANAVITNAAVVGGITSSYTGPVFIERDVAGAASQEECDQTISTSGTVTLSNDIATDKQTAICIQASGVTLDCNGHKITGDGWNTGLRAVGVGDLTISNCVFDNFINAIDVIDATSLTVAGTTVSNIFDKGITADYVGTVSITGFTCTDTEICVSGDEDVVFSIDTATATGVGAFAYIDPNALSITNVQATQTVQQMWFGPPTITIISGGTVNLGGITINGAGIKVSGGASVTGTGLAFPSSGEGNDKMTIEGAPDVSLNGVTGSVGDGATGIVITNSGNVAINNIVLTGTDAGAQGVKITDAESVIATGVTMNGLLEGMSIINTPAVTANNLVANNIFGTALSMDYGTNAAVNGITVNTAGIGVSVDEFSTAGITGGDFDNVDMAIAVDYGIVTVSSTDINTADVGVKAIAPDGTSILNLNGVTMTNVDVGVDAFKGVVNANPVTISAITTGINLAGVAGATITGSAISDAETGVYVDADSNNVLLESTVFSGNTVDINNQDAATGNANTCDSSKVVNYHDDGQVNGCDASSTARYADIMHLDLHVVDQAKTNACPGGKGSCKIPVEGVLFKVFDRNVLGYTPTREGFGAVYEGSVGLVSSCTTNANGDCTAYETAAGRYIVIGKYVDQYGTVYVGSPKDPSDFVQQPDGTFAVTKNLQILKKIASTGTKTKPATKITLEGSYLEIIFPDPWLENQYYEVIADSAPDGGVWADVQVTLEPPTGYNADPNPVVLGTIANEVKWGQSYITKVGSDPSDPFVLKITAEEKAVVNPITGAAVAGKNQKKELYVVVEGNGKNARDKALNKATQLHAQGKQVHVGGKKFNSQSGSNQGNGAGGIAPNLPKLK